jgi:hypothetical protein
MGTRAKMLIRNFTKQELADLLESIISEAGAIDDEMNRREEMKNDDD